MTFRWSWVSFPTALCLTVSLRLCGERLIGLLSPLPFNFGLGTSNWFTDLGVVTAARSCNSSDKQGADTEPLRKQMIDK